MSRSGSRAPGTNDANHRSASHTLIRCGSADSWSWLPIRLRSSPAWVSGSRPSTRIRPPSARRSPCRHSTVVVFPAPLRPRMPKISPRPTSKLDAVDDGSSAITLRQALDHDHRLDHDALQLRQTDRDYPRHTARVLALSPPGNGPAGSQRSAERPLAPGSSATSRRADAVASAGFTQPPSRQNRGLPPRCRQSPEPRAQNCAIRAPAPATRPPEARAHSRSALNYLGRAGRFGYARLLGSGHQPPEAALPDRSAGAESGASAGPTEPPQVRDTAGGPHRNPTDETAHSGTLVMRVKRHGEQPVSSVDARELGCWSLFQVSALGMTELLKSGRSAVRPCP